MLYKILLVDDDSHSLDLFTRAFEKVAGHCVLVAAVSTDALDVLSIRADLVLVNFHLKPSPEGGISAARCVRENGYLGPLWIFNGDACPSLLFSALLVGADEYLLQCNPDELIAQLKQIAVTRAVVSRNNDAPLPSTPRETSLLSRVIRQSPYLKIAGLSESETTLLGEFAVNGYPRLKEFSGRLSVSETSLWKRFARIRDKLNMDSMSQIAHLVTLLSMMETRREHRRCTEQYSTDEPRRKIGGISSAKQ